MTVSVKQAQLQLTELIERSSKGEEIVITSDGQPVARLVPSTLMAPPIRSVLEQITSLPNLHRDPSEWRQIEQSLQRERDAWDR